VASADLAVCLHRVGRNLNRAYRTCEAFGVTRLLLHECDPAAVARIGNLFAAAGGVSVEAVVDWPDPTTSLAMETCHEGAAWDVDWSRVSTVLIGGETDGLARSAPAAQQARIPMRGRVSGLTVEAALAVVLYERSRCPGRPSPWHAPSRTQAEIVDAVRSGCSTGAAVSARTGVGGDRLRYRLVDLVRMGRLTLSGRTYAVAAGGDSC
jgi:hypothetical protein